MKQKHNDVTIAVDMNDPGTVLCESEVH